MNEEKIFELFIWHSDAPRDFNQETITANQGNSAQKKNLFCRLEHNIQEGNRCHLKIRNGIYIATIKSEVKI